MPVSNIDDLLMGGTGNSLQPETPENKVPEEPEEIKELDYNDTEDNHNDQDENEDDEAIDPDSENEEGSEKHTKKKPAQLDEYGNIQEPENEAIRERLGRQARKYEAEIDALRVQLAQQGASPHVQRAAQDFEYDPNAAGDWQQQLRQFVKQTVQSMSHEEHEIQRQNQEARVQAEFESKFRDGMNRFGDFKEVITALPFEITNPMTLATRGMDNPAAFLYAAAKRHPKELERIAKLPDPYAQMTEIGKLEERMRKNKQPTKAPRPLGRAPEDSITNTPKKKADLTGDDLLAKADANRLQKVRQRHKANR